MMERKQFIVIGLGRFGSSVARTLYANNTDVLAIDSDGAVIQEIADDVTKAIQADATDEIALRDLGIRNFDVAVIAIGSDIQSSIIATLLVKELGVKYIIAKALNDKHSKILYKIGADRVILPEKDMGMRVAHNLISTGILDYIELSPDYSIAEITCPQEWQGKTLAELNLRVTHGINIIAIKRGDAINISPGANDTVQSDDIAVVIANANEISTLRM
jgi:trk system potassium uptake protein TrkA